MFVCVEGHRQQQPEAKKLAADKLEMAELKRQKQQQQQQLIAQQKVSVAANA